MPTFDAALIKEHGADFAVVSVRRGVIESLAARDELRAELSQAFGGVPVVLMDIAGGQPRYYGPPELVEVLAGLFVEQLPWAEYRMN